MLLVLSSAYKAGAASGLTIERALRIIHLGTILAAVKNSWKKRDFSTSQVCGQVAKNDDGVSSWKTGFLAGKPRCLRRTFVFGLLFRSLLFLQRKSEDAVHVYLHVRPFCIHEFNDNFPQLLSLAKTDTRLGFFVI